MSLIAHATRIARMGPCVLQFVVRLARDPDVSWVPRAIIGCLVLYLMMPFDLIPDFIPVIGLLDDAVVVAIVLRLALRTVDRATAERHWPGVMEDLDVLYRYAGRLHSPAVDCGKGLPS